MAISLLGPLEVYRDGTLVRIGSLKQRILLALMALDAGRVVGVDRLVTAMWGDESVANPGGSLQVCVHGLRRTLGTPDLPSASIVWRSSGYVLDVDPDVVDVHRFRALVAQARGSAPGDLADASKSLAAALAMWRGPVLADLASERIALAISGPLQDELLTATEDFADVELGLGRHQGLVPRLEELVQAHPLRERLYGLLMIALYRSGRQAQALTVFKRARTTLNEELGLEPGPELRELEQAVLTQSPALMAVASSPLRSTTVLWKHEANGAAYLLLKGGDQVQLSSGDFVIGRDDGADLTLVDTRISRRHAVLRQVTLGYELEDLASTNGTFVNGKRLTPHNPVRLVDGDEVAAAATKMMFATASSDFSETDA